MVKEEMIIKVIGYCPKKGTAVRKRVHAFFYKKVVYKKVYIKWPKLKKVFIYNILILRNFFV